MMDFASLAPSREDFPLKIAVPLFREIDLVAFNEKSLDQ